MRLRIPRGTMIRWQLSCLIMIQRFLSKLKFFFFFIEAGRVEDECLLAL